MKTTNKLPKFPGLVVAYHGCDRVVARSVISGSADLKDSNNPYDWLGYDKYIFTFTPPPPRNISFLLCV